MCLDVVFASGRISGTAGAVMWIAQYGVDCVALRGFGLSRMLAATRSE